MSYLPICHKDKCFVIELTDTDVSKDYLLHLRKELIEYQRIQKYRSEIEYFINDDETGKKVIDLNLEQLIKELKDEYKVDEVSSISYCGCVTDVKYKLNKVSVPTGKQHFYNTGWGYVPVQKVENKEEIETIEKHYILLDAIGKKNPLLLKYLSLYTGGLFEFKKLNEYLEKKTDKNVVTIPEFELDNLEFIKILCNYFQKLNKREIRIFNTNPFLRDMGETNYELLEKDYYPLRKNLVK